jgi:hypothetical protein
VRNTVLGTLEVKQNGATGENGPRAEDIKNKLSKQNVSINGSFIDDLTINDATRVESGGTNLYEYQATIECSTAMLQKYPFIKSDTDSVVVNFYGIQDGYAAFKQTANQS